MNGISASSLSLISTSVTKTLQHSLQQFNTHEHFGNLIYFSGKSHILENVASLARGWTVSPWVNTTSIYLVKIISAFNFSSDPFVNKFPWFFIYLSCCLRQLLSYSCYVSVWMNILLPRIIWWLWFIFRNCGGKINQRAESLIRKIHFKHMPWKTQ